MNRKTVSKVAIFMAAGMTSACNSTDSPYRQGPWGTVSTARSYPAYSAPWGGPPVVAYGVAARPVPEAIQITEVPLHPTPKGHDILLEPELPPRPIPGRSAVTVGPGSESLVEPGPEQHTPAQRETIADAGTSAPGVITPPQRPSSYAGTWKASVGSASCRIQLSSIPSLDLYKASAQGCSSVALKAVNGWSIRDDQVILFSRGQVVARLSGAEAALSGRLSGSDTEMTMTR